MSCCGGNCGCGANSNCGDGCRGCKKFPDWAFGDMTVAARQLPSSASNMTFEKNATVAGEKGGCGCASGCKCGANSSCTVCNCCK